MSWWTQQKLLESPNGLHCVQSSKYRHSWDSATSTNTSSRIFMVWHAPCSISLRRKFCSSRVSVFCTLIHAFSTAPVLALPDHCKPFWLITDASDIATGAILEQPDALNRWHPIAYHSKSLQPAEHNYEIHDFLLLSAPWRSSATILKDRKTTLKSGQIIGLFHDQAETYSLPGTMGPVPLVFLVHYHPQARSTEQIWCAVPVSRP